MSFHPLNVIFLVVALAGCAAAPEASPDLAAKNRPLEQRCARLQPGRSLTRPDLTRADVQEQARQAARRGELDKACDWL